jgi:hypothetical protein
VSGSEEEVEEVEDEEKAKGLEDIRNPDVVTKSVPPAI